MLKLETDPRESARGGAEVAWLEGGAGSVNPASLGGIHSSEVNFSYNQLFEGLRHGALGYSHPLAGMGLGAQISTLEYGDIERFDSQGERLGGVKAADRVFRLGVAWRREKLVPGIGVELAQEELDGITATALGLNAGVIYRPAPVGGDASIARLLRRMSFGASLRRLGGSARFAQRKEKLPTALRVGAAYQGFADALKIAFDLEQVKGTDQSLVLHLGGEYWLKNLAALRAGLRTDRDAGMGLSIGMGFRAGKNMTVDYAFSPLGELGDAHRVQLSYRFGGGLADKYYREGVEQLRAGNYAEAVLLFDKALVIDPGNRRVLEKAVEAARALRERPEDDGAAPGR